MQSKWNLPDENALYLSRDSRDLYFNGFFNMGISQVLLSSGITIDQLKEKEVWLVRDSLPQVIRLLLENKELMQASSFVFPREYGNFLPSWDNFFYQKVVQKEKKETDTILIKAPFVGEPSLNLLESDLDDLKSYIHDKEVFFYYPYVTEVVGTESVEEYGNEPLGNEFEIFEAARKIISEKINDFKFVDRLFFRRLPPKDKCSFVNLRRHKALLVGEDYLDHFLLSRGYCQLEQEVSNELFLDLSLHHGMKVFEKEKNDDEVFQKIDRFCNGLKKMDEEILIAPSLIKYLSESNFD